MKQAGHIEVVNVLGIEFVENGRSLRFEIIESIPPHATSFVTFKNACCVKLFQSGSDEFPLVVIDLTWQAIPAEERHQVLASHEYPISNESGEPLPADRPLVWAHLEGEIVGDVLAEQVVVSPA
jgi:hypothetical protein